MKAKNFRIGNLAKDSLTNETLICCGLNCETDGRNPQITFAVIDRSKYPLPNGWKAEEIKINDEWLNVYGFKKDNYDDYWIDLETHYLVLRKSKDAYYPIYFELPELSSEQEQGVSLNAVKYVHELQNLFFALTGEELELKTDLSH